MRPTISATRFSLAENVNKRNKWCVVSLSFDLSFVDLLTGSTNSRKV